MSGIEQTIDRILTPGTDEQKAASAICEALAQKMGNTGSALYTSEEVVRWLRDCCQAMGGWE